MILSIVLFLLDCIAATLCRQWIISSLLFYFIAEQLFDAEYDYSMRKFYVPLALLLIQDFMLYGRFGLGLLWLMPLQLAIWWARRIVLHGTFFIPPLLVAVCILVDTLVIKAIVGVSQPLLVVTIGKICYTWICGIIIFLGLRGNRCLSSSSR
jgi:hypothetical protein